MSRPPADGEYLVRRTFTWDDGTSAADYADRGVRSVTDRGVLTLTGGWTTEPAEARVWGTRAGAQRFAERWSTDLGPLDVVTLDEARQK